MIIFAYHRRWWQRRTLVLPKCGRIIESLRQFTVDPQRHCRNPLKMPRKQILPPPLSSRRHARVAWSSTTAAVTSKPARPPISGPSHPATKKRTAGVQGDDHHPLARHPHRPSGCREPIWRRKIPVSPNNSRSFSRKSWPNYEKCRKRHRIDPLVSITNAYG